jgi:hypothetical protein
MTRDKEKETIDEWLEELEEEEVREEDDDGNKHNT